MNYIFFCISQSSPENRCVYMEGERDLLIYFKALACASVQAEKSRGPLSTSRRPQKPAAVPGLQAWNQENLWCN